VKSGMWPPLETLSARRRRATRNPSNRSTGPQIVCRSLSAPSGAHWEHTERWPCLPLWRLNHLRHAPVVPTCRPRLPTTDVHLGRNGKAVGRSIIDAPVFIRQAASASGFRRHQGETIVVQLHRFGTWMRKATEHGEAQAALQEAEGGTR